MNATKSSKTIQESNERNANEFSENEQEAESAKNKTTKENSEEEKKKNNEVMHSIFPPNSMNTLVFVHAISRFLNWNSCNMMLIMQNEQNQAKWMNNTRWPKQNTEIHAKFSQKRISSRTKGKL